MPAVMTKRKYNMTDRELELLPLLCLPYKIIGQHIGMDSGTVSVSITRLLAKFKVENRMALIVKLLKLDILNIDQLTIREF